MKPLLKKQRHCLDQLAKYGNVIRGSIHSVCSTCNRATCICKHPANRKAYRLTYKDKHQTTRIVYIPRNRLREIKRMISNYSKIRKMMDQLIEVNIEIFKQGLKT